MFTGFIKPSFYEQWKLYLCEYFNYQGARRNQTYDSNLKYLFSNLFTFVYIVYIFCALGVFSLYRENREKGKIEN